MLRRRDLGSWLFTCLPILVRTLRFYLLWVNILFSPPVFRSTSLRFKIYRTLGQPRNTNTTYMVSSYSFQINSFSSKGEVKPPTSFTFKCEKTGGNRESFFSLPHLLIQVGRICFIAPVYDMLKQWLGSLRSAHTMNIAVNLKTVFFVKTLMQFVNL